MKNLIILFLLLTGYTGFVFAASQSIDLELPYTWVGRQNFTGGTSVGSSTPSLVATTTLTVGPALANGSSTISAGKIQFDGYTSAGARRCFFFQASGLLGSSPGACK